MSEKETEQEIQNRGLTAPRLTPDLIDAALEGYLLKQELSA